jgi:hypothetical protein
VVVYAVFSVSVAVSAAVPVISTDEVTPQVVGLIGEAGVAVTAHVRFTFPVNAPAGVVVIVTVLPVVAPAWKLIAPLFVSAMLGGAFTVTLTGVDDVTLPVTASFPVTVTV